MSSDIKFRLTATRRVSAPLWNDEVYPINPDGAEAVAHIEALEGEVERLRVALEKIEQGDYERSERNFYNTLARTPSKHDTCGHCCASFARKALEADK